MLQKFKHIFQEKPLFAAIIVFVVSFFVFGAVYFTFDGFVTLDDHLFHYRLAKMIRTEGLGVVNNFQWVYFSKMAQDGLRFNVSLFHFAIIPFTFFKDDLFGVKCIDVFGLSLSLGLFYYVLRKFRIPWALGYLLMLGSSYHFFSRFLMGRAFALVASIVLLEMYFAIHRKYKQLFLVALLHVLWHQSTFIFPLLIVGCVELIRGMRTAKFDFRNLGASALAAVIGMGIYTGYPANLYEWMGAIFRIHSNVRDESGLRLIEGRELNPTDPALFLRKSDVLFLGGMLGVAIAFGLYLRFRQNGINDEASSQPDETDETLLTALFSLTFFFLTIILGSIAISGRIFDFYFPCAVLLFAVGMTVMIRHQWLIVHRSIRPFLMGAVLIFFLATLGNALLDLKSQSAVLDPQPMMQAAAWVAERSEPKEVVFLESWSTFPLAFFANQKNYYSFGMEPAMMLEYDQRLFWIWYNIHENKIFCELPRNCIEEKRKLSKQFEKDPKMEDAFLKQQVEQMLAVVRKDFQSRFFISSSAELSAMIQKRPDLYSDMQTYTSDANNAAITVFQLR